MLSKPTYVDPSSQVIATYLNRASMPPKYPGRAACLHCYKTYGLTTICHLNDPLCSKKDTTIKGPCRYCYETYAYEYECHGTDPKCHGKALPEQQPQFTERHAKVPWYVEIPKGYIHDPQAICTKGAIMVLPAGAPDDERPPGVDFVPPIRCVPYNPEGPRETHLAVQRVERSRRDKVGRRIHERLQEDRISAEVSKLESVIHRTRDQHIEHQMWLRDHERQLYDSFYGPSMDAGQGFDIELFSKERRARHHEKRLDDAVFKELFRRQLLQHEISFPGRPDQGLGIEDQQRDSERLELIEQLGYQSDQNLNRTLLDQLNDQLDRLDVSRYLQRSKEEEIDSEENLYSVSDDETEVDEDQQHEQGLLDQLDPLFQQAQSTLQEAFGRAKLAVASVAPVYANPGEVDSEAREHEARVWAELESRIKTLSSERLGDKQSDTTEVYAAKMEQANAIIQRAKVITEEITAIAERVEASHIQAAVESEKAEATSSKAEANRPRPAEHQKKQDEAKNKPSEVNTGSNSSAKGKKKASRGRKKK